MVVGEAIHNIMGGIENTGTIKQHNHKKKLRQRFDIIKKLGQGTFGKVQLGINKETGQEVAIKTIKKSKIETEADLVRIRREIQIMSSVQHPNIIHIYEVFENREKMVLVMEYAAGGELYDYLSERKVLDEEEARRIFRQIATACYYCHKHKICHRDLKLENILLDENNNAKIADFGLSNVFDDQRLLNTFCGSPLYASPEIVKGTPYHGPEVDCWSLGILLYTLVYGAMPFDGSTFKGLVKQISQGDYFEPAKQSRASPLIREILTVNPKQRADIEKICSHWWVNEGYSESCLDISEELANQTPVRLDVLLSLAPPPPQLESEKLMLTGDDESNKVESIAPARSQSVGSLIELSHPSERRIINLVTEEKAAPKRKLETTVSTDKANLDKRKDKIVKENTVADITVRGAGKNNASLEDASMSESLPLDRSSTQTISKEKMDVETELASDPSLQGAACAELIEEAEKKKPAKIKKSLTTSVSNKVLEDINEAPSQENVAVQVDKENIKAVPQEKTKKEESSEGKKPVKKKPATKKVLTDKNENSKKDVQESVIDQKPVANEKPETKEVKENEPESPSKPVERRKSRIFEAAEKFQNMMTPPESKPMLTEKPKKVIIPGVSVDGFKKEFERKASLTQTPNAKTALTKKDSQEITEGPESKSETEAISESIPAQKAKVEKVCQPATDKTDEFQERERVKNAVSIISSALDKEGTRKSKSRPCMMRKPPVPFGVSGRSASGNIGIISPLSPPSGPKPFVKPIFDKREETAAQKHEEEDKTSLAEITLKSATLPRTKTSRAEITLKYPMPKPATMEFVTEMAHNVEAYQPPSTQRSEIIVPVSGAPSVGFRANESNKGSKERIIPIAFEKQEAQSQDKGQSPPDKPTVSKPLQSQMSDTSQTSNLSRQSTQDSDSDTIASTGEPIKKSDREYIIPIAVEGGGYVTPRAGSLEPNESSTSSINRSRTKFGRTRRLNTFFNDRDSEDESSPFSSLHRHGSIGRDSDNEDSKRDAFHMHRLRSTRADRRNLEHTDSISSGEEDDDEGFEILTAENLFSTLLSRVKDLTQRLNVDDNIRPGFPSSRFLSHFDHGTNFWNRIEHPITRHASLGRSFSRDRPISKTSTGNSFGVPWRRSVTRDTTSDNNVFPNSDVPTGQRPTGDDLSKEENLNLADLDLKKLKLSEEDALALSYLTPSLSRRIQKQLLSQLPPSEIKKLHRTLSANAPDEKQKDSKFTRRSAERISSTLPRKLSVDNNRNFNMKEEREKPKDLKTPRSFLPIKKDEYRPSYEFNLRSSSIGAEPRGESRFLHYRPKVGKSVSLVEPRNYTLPKSEVQSPESSLSESLSSSYRNNDSLDSSSRYISDSSVSRPCSKYSSDSYSRYVPNKSLDSASSVTSIDLNKTDVKKPSLNTKRISRFLRPDFFEVPQEENIYMKEKKEREMETQKVLKEIRDKRKTRLNMRRERSESREKQLERIKYSPNKNKENEIKECDNLLYNVSHSSNNLEENVAGTSGHRKTTPTPIQHKPELPENSTPLHDYVNVKAPERLEKPKKENISRIARPKSYPTESVEKIQTSSDKDSKIRKSKKGFSRTCKEKTKDEKNETNKIINEEDKVHKNKLLQSIEKKLEKFRSNNNATAKEGEELVPQEKKSTVESAIKRLREQSLPRNLEHCTESGLIKRAVSVEDLSNATPLQASRKSVTKILGLFKKYEDQDSKRKTLKKTKSKDSAKNKSNNKESENKPTSDVINHNKHSEADELNGNTHVSASESSQSDLGDKKERPRSLLFDKVKKFQNSYSSAKSDSVLNSDSRESKTKSKLPVNSFRRSLNLDNLPEPPKFYKNPSKSNINENEQRTDRKNLKLDFSKIPHITETPASEPVASTSLRYDNHLGENRNSLVTTDDSSTVMSPSDDYMSCDSWSVCSDFHHANDLYSPVSPNGNHIYSGDENESVIDRIRRKSFYTRFNENKRPRRHSSFRDADLSYKTPGDYASLDRKSYDYKSPINRRSSYSSSLLQEPSKTYRPYTRSSSMLHDYVNVPNQYQTYSSKISRPNSSLYGDFEENDTLDDLLSTARSKKYSSQIQPSRLGRTSVSPVNEYLVDHTTSSVLSPTKSEPI